MLNPNSEDQQEDLYPRLLEDSKEAVLIEFKKIQSEEAAWASQEFLSGQKPPPPLVPEASALNSSESNNDRDLALKGMSKVWDGVTKYCQEYPADATTVPY